MMNDSLWTTARAQMLLDPTVANLNTGSFGPLPRPVFDHVTDLRRQLAEEPMRFLLRTAPPWLWYARKRLAEFVGADPRRLVFTANVTAAINLVASSLRLESPGELLMTDYEYGAMVWCWERAAHRLGLVVRTFPLPLRPRRAQDIVDAACTAMTRRTRLFFFSHVLSPTGMILPARELCAAARTRNIPTVVDGAHAPAFIPNLRLDEIGADFYGANCHKWLLAPTGAGFLYLGSSAGWDLLQPLQVSWGWQKDSSRGLDGEDEFGSTPHIRHLEFEGTRDPCAWLAVPTAIDFQHRIGWQLIRARIDELVRHVRARLEDELGLERVTPGLPHLRGPMTALRLPPGTSAPALRHRLWHEHQVEAPIIERPDGLLIRVSTHFYNTEEEVDRLAVALRCLCRS